MVDAVLTFALQTVGDLLIEEVNFLQGVRGEVVEIERELKRMKRFLEYADAKEDVDLMLHHRVVEINELAQEVEDVLEIFAIEITSRRQRSDSRGFKNVLRRLFFFIFNEGVAFHKVGSEIASIKTKITNLSNSLQVYYNLGQVGQSSLDSSTTFEKQRWQRMSFPHFEEDFVGMEEDIRRLVFHLVHINESNKQCSTFVRVVSIGGMGGIGKTSLAKKIYNHIEVRHYFECFAWVCVTQCWQAREILQDILIGLIAEKRERIVNLTDQQLVDQLYQVQQAKKCLIVLDDVWSKDAWNILKPAFPRGKIVISRILLTTRHRKVALHADPTGFLHEPQCLSEEESWHLLQRKAFPARDIENDFSVDRRMERAGREMVRQCRGLPLAVVVLGGILVTKHTYEEWEVVLQNVKTYLAKGEEGIGEEYGGVSHVLGLSYKNLPYQLKRCFLYLGNFRADFEIRAEKLYNLWNAEGIISLDDRRQGETMMDVAERYLGELAQRCMVQVRVKKISRIRRIKSCKLHDLMRDVCLSKIEGNSLKANVNESLLLDACSSTSKTRRVLIRSKNENHEFLRKCGSGINDFKWLRVLDFEELPYIHNLWLPKAIGNLMQLRYLNLRFTTLRKLPPSIGELIYLQTLDLRTLHDVFIPNVLWKLQRLRHLYLPRHIHVEENTKLRLDGVSNLETLENLDSEQCDFKGLVHLNNLRELRAWVHNELAEMSHLQTMIASKSPLLRKTYLGILNCNCQSEEGLVVLKKLLGNRHLYKLVIGGCVSSRLPDHYHFSPSLTKLILRGTQLDDESMATLEKLPSLVNLEIRDKCFKGKEMVCSATGFPQLRVFRLVYALNLEIWRVEGGAFPKLSHLDIISCPMLKMMPNGLIYVTTLKQLTILDMSEEFNDRVRVVNGREGKDFHKVRHVSSIRFTTH